MADNLKPKEPLLSLMISFIYPGLGQICSGYIRRGILFIAVPLIITVVLLWYVILPETRTHFLMLVILIVGAIFGLYVIIDSYLSATRFNKENNLERNISLGKRILYIVGMFICLFVIDVTAPVTNYVKNNVIQAFKISSGAMSPTLNEGDRVLAYKNVYVDEKPKRGDIAVFKYPPDPSREFLKRVIATGGEIVEIKNGVVYISDREVEHPIIRNTYYYNRGDYAKEGEKITVPEGHYFVLGDNSKSSADSRFWGFVPEANFIGKAFKIYYPFDRSGLIDRL